MARCDAGGLATGANGDLVAAWATDRRGNGSATATTNAGAPPHPRGPAAPAAPRPARAGDAPRGPAPRSVAAPNPGAAGAVSVRRRLLDWCRKRSVWQADGRRHAPFPTPIQEPPVQCQFTNG